MNLEPLESRTLLNGALDAQGDGGEELVYAMAAMATPTVTVRATDAKAYESSAKPNRGYFTFTRDGSTATELKVNFTISGNARNGVDYQAIAKSITIPAGLASASIMIDPINDSVIEKTETVGVTLANNAAYMVGASSVAVGRIYDNDGPVVTVVPASNAAELGRVAGAFTLRRFGPLTQPLTVSYGMIGKARNGVDYSRTTGSVTFKAGKKFAKVQIVPIDDLTVEATETVTLRLGNGYYVVGASWQATLNLTDNDQNPAGNGGGGTDKDAIVFRSPGAVGAADVLYVAPNAGAVPNNISDALDAFSAGIDDAINISPDGDWFVLHTTRFGGQAGQYSLAVVQRTNLPGGQQIRIDGNLIVPADSSSAIASGGNTVVYASEEGPHERDLWAATRAADVWSKTLLTNDSTYAYNMQPSLSVDGQSIIFAAGNTAAGGDAIAEVDIDGTGFDALITVADGPVGFDPDAVLTYPDFGLNGDIVFGSSWTGDQIWKLASGAGAPTRISPPGQNDNEYAPRVLSDGRIVSLWDRPAGDPAAPTGIREITLRYANGNLQGTILPGIDFPISALGSGA